MDIVEILNQYGFATLAAIAMGYFIFFIYTYVTTQIIEKLDNTMKVLIALIDRVRMLDNDIIRLRSKLNTVLEIRENEKKKTLSQSFTSIFNYLCMFFFHLDY